MEEPHPIFVASNQVRFTAICQKCASEKRGWSEGETHVEVQVSGELPLDSDAAWLECPRGHRNLVIREGSERAKNFA